MGSKLRPFFVNIPQKTLLYKNLRHFTYSTNESLIAQNSLHQACHKLVKACNCLWLLYDIVSFQLSKFKSSILFFIKIFSKILI